MNEILLAIINEASWPLAVLVCFFFIRKELSGLLERIKGFKAGSVEFLLTEELQETKINDDQLSAIASLSAEKIDLFLLVSYSESIGFKYELPISRESFKTRLGELQETGLITVKNIDAEEGLIEHDITPLGFQVRTLLLQGSRQLLRASATREKA